MALSRLTPDELKEFILLYQQPLSQDLVSQAEQLLAQAISQFGQRAVLTNPISDLYLASNYLTKNNVTQFYRASDIQKVDQNTLLVFAQIFELPSNEPDLRTRIIRILRIIGALIPEPEQLEREDYRLAQIYLSRGGQINQKYEKEFILQSDSNTLNSFAQVFGIGPNHLGQIDPTRVVRILTLIGAISQPTPEDEEDPSSPMDATLPSPITIPPSPELTPKLNEGQVTPSSEVQGPASSDKSNEVQGTPSSDKSNEVQGKPSNEAQGTPSSDKSNEVQDSPSNEVQGTPSSDKSNKVQDSPSNEVQGTPSNEVQDTPSNDRSNEDQDSPSNEVQTPPSNESQTSPSNEVQTSPSNESQDSPSNESQDSPSNEDQTPSSNEVQDPPSNEVQGTPSNEVQDPPSNEDQTPSSNEVQTSPSNEVQTPPSNEAQDSSPNEAQTPQSEVKIRAPSPLPSPISPARVISPLKGSKVVSPPSNSYSNLPSSLPSPAKTPARSSKTPFSSFQTASPVKLTPPASPISLTDTPVRISRPSSPPIPTSQPTSPILAISPSSEMVIESPIVSLSPTKTSQSPGSPNQSLIRAAGQGNLGVVKGLAENAAAHTQAAMIAAEEGRLDVVKYLLKNYDISRELILRTASQNGKTDIVKLILDERPDLIEKAVQGFGVGGHLEALETIGDPDDWVGIFLIGAAEGDHLDLVKDILDIYEIPIEDLNLALEKAAYLGRNRIIKRLMEEPVTNYKQAMFQAIQAGRQDTANIFRMTEKVPKSAQLH